MMRLSAFGSKMATSVIVASALASHMTNIAQAAPFPYVNDFSSMDLTNMAEEFTLDTGNGVLNVNHPIEGGTVASVASEEITGIGTSDFVVSTRFTMNEIEGTGNGITAGFGVFSQSDVFDVNVAPLYLVDWRLGGGGDEIQMGNLRILKGEFGGFTTIDNSGNAGLGEVGETYELRLTGTFAENGVLAMTLAVFDDAGDQLGTETSGEDSFPLGGEFFGLRNRTAGADHVLDIDYHQFSVTSPETGDLDGDFNGDGQVDAADYTVWRDGLGGQFTSDQYDVWRNNFGATAGSGAVAAVSEPAAFGLVLLVLIGMSLFRPWVRTANGC